MPAGAWLDLDLLRRRRQQLGLELPKPVPARALIVRGGLVGGGLVMVVMLACTAVWLVSRWLEQRQTSLAPAVAAYEEAQARIGSANKDLEQLQASNTALAEAIAGVRSGSAVLMEISRVVPQRLQITKLKVLGSSLELSGTVLQPLGLDVVNAFQLRLEGSPFFQPDGVTLVKAVETAAPGASASTASGPAASAAPALLNFDLTAAFATTVAKISAQQLLDLGALGSARRRELLQREGLLK